MSSKDVTTGRKTLYSFYCKLMIFKVYVIVTMVVAVVVSLIFYAMHSSYVIADIFSFWYLLSVVGVLPG